MPNETSSLEPPVRPRSRPGNQLLAALPLADFERLRPQLTTVPIRTRLVLQKQGEPVEFVYFPNGGVVSIVTSLSDGTSVEAATVGDEGMLGIEAFLGRGAIAPGETFVQVPDTDAERLSVSDFREELGHYGALHEIMGRYTRVVIAQMMQTTACNALHGMQQRCARWILTTHDRMHGADFTLSQEFLAMMLGARRPTVSLAASTLQAAGLISYSRGRIRVLDREGLEAAACECYPVVRRYFESLVQ